MCTIYVHTHTYIIGQSWHEDGETSVNQWWSFSIRYPNMYNKCLHVQTLDWHTPRYSTRVVYVHFYGIAYILSLVHVCNLLYLWWWAKCPIASLNSSTATLNDWKRELVMHTFHDVIMWLSCDYHVILTLKTLSWSDFFISCATPLSVCGCGCVSCDVSVTSTRCSPSSLCW